MGEPGEEENEDEDDGGWTGPPLERDPSSGLVGLCLLVIVGSFGILALVLTLPFTPLFAYRKWQRRRRWLDGLRAQERLIGWDDAVRRAAAGEGRLIVEFMIRGTGELWWVEGFPPSCPFPDVSALDPGFRRNGVKFVMNTLMAPEVRKWRRDHWPHLTPRASLVLAKRGRWRELPPKMVLVASAMPGALFDDTVYTPDATPKAKGSP